MYHHEPAPLADGSTTCKSGTRQCSICCDDLHTDDDVTFPTGRRGTYTLDCDHSFHTQCIVNWFRSSQNATQCPICRAPPQLHDSEEGGSSARVPEPDTISELSAIELPLHERDMNSLLREHLHFARRRNCPMTLKQRVIKYRESRQVMIEKRKNLFKHEREASGRYVELRRHSVKLHNKLLTAQSRFVKCAMVVYATPLST